MYNVYIRNNIVSSRLVFVQAKLAGIAIYPSYVLGGVFLFVLVGSLLVVGLPSIRLLSWF